jgi:hypothetical protein
VWIANHKCLQFPLSSPQRAAIVPLRDEPEGGELGFERKLKVSIYIFDPGIGMIEFVVRQSSSVTLISNMTEFAHSRAKFISYWNCDHAFLDLSLYFIILSTGVDLSVIRISFLVVLERKFSMRLRGKKMMSPSGAPHFSAMGSPAVPRLPTYATHLLGRVEGAEGREIHRLLGGFDAKSHWVTKYMCQRYATPTRRDLVDIASCVIKQALALGLSTPLEFHKTITRAHRRSRPLLFKWFADNWTIASQVLPYIALADENARIVTRGVPLPCHATPASS